MFHILVTVYLDDFEGETKKVAYFTSMFDFHRRDIAQVQTEIGKSFFFVIFAVHLNNFSLLIMIHCNQFKQVKFSKCNIKDTGHY